MANSRRRSWCPGSPMDIERSLRAVVQIIKRAQFLRENDLSETNVIGMSVRRPLIVPLRNQTARSETDSEMNPANPNRRKMAISNPVIAAVIWNRSPVSNIHRTRRSVVESTGEMFSDSDTVTATGCHGK